MSEHKKIAPRAATPETKNRKILSINSILKNAGDVKVLIKEPSECVTALDDFALKVLRLGNFRFRGLKELRTARVYFRFDDRAERSAANPANRGAAACRWLMNHKI